MAHGSGTGVSAIVVGAGVVGTSLAFHLARAGTRVRVFDKGGICAGMSARSGALVRMHYTFAPEAELAWNSLRYFRNWEEIVGGRCGFVRTGFTVVVGSENASRLRANVEMLRAIGIETFVVNPDEFRALEPEANAADVALAAYEPQSGYADPIATTTSFADAAKRNGAQFVTDNPVAAIKTGGGRATGIVDAAGIVHEADVVCIAAGPWTDPLLRPLGVQIGICAERAQIAFFKRASGLRHCGYIDTIAGSYFRPHGDALTLAGLGELTPEVEADPDRFRESNDEDFVGRVRTRLGRRIPRMADAPYVRGHAGIYDVSPDSRAVMGAVPGIASLFVAAGFSGTGFKTAPAVGAAMAELMLEGQARTADISAFSFERLVADRLIQSPNEYVMGTGFGHKI